MTTPHLPDDTPLPPVPRGVLPLDLDLGSAGGQRIVVLSLEVWEGWADLRFARIDVGATRRLTRRVPPVEAWTVDMEGRRIEVVDAVGRGDRTFSNGEVRLVPPPTPGATLHLEVQVVPDHPPLSGEVRLPATTGPAPRPEVEIFGGQEPANIRLMAHDPAWEATARAHIDRVRGLLGDVRVEHVGSTAVRGLAAKPIVDLQLSVADVDDEPSYLTALEAGGYVLRVREITARHRMLRTAPRDVHLHVCDVGGTWERDHLLFRDHLRHDAGDRRRYEAVKQDLAARDWPTMQHYADAKAEIIADITRRAEAWAAMTGWDSRARATDDGARHDDPGGIAP